MDKAMYDEVAKERAKLVANKIGARRMMYNETPAVKDLKGILGNVPADDSPVNPSHYKKGNIEVIDFINDQKFNYLEGNIIKYVSRYKFKNGIEDLNKAKWYLDTLIKQQEESKSFREHIKNHTAAELARDSWNEERINIIGQNGNDGDHYND